MFDLAILAGSVCLLLQALIAFSRVGVYIRLPGVDVDAFSQHMQGGGLLSYIDALSGGSVSRVGIFSLGMQLCLYAHSAISHCS